MSNKLIISCSLTPLLLLLSFYGNNSSFLNNDLPLDQGRVEYRVVVKLINDEWRVVLEDDESQSDVTLRRGDRIRWIVEGSDASFSFPETRIFGQETRDVRAGNPLVLAISQDSPQGEFPYTVFIHESMTYARGQSPPRIIVRE